MNRKPQGVISYAGLDVSTLLAGARLMFAGSEDILPRRFASLMPLLPMELIQSMPFVGVAQPGQNVAPGGFSIDPAEYHCMLHEQMPRLYVGDNLARNTDTEGMFHGRGIVTVDEAWTTCFPQYQPFQGERLTIYPLGGGAQAAAVPESLYPRAAGFLRAAETALGITKRCHDYAYYVYQRIRSGHSFDADVFETDYLAQNQLSPVTLTQSDLGRMMQDVAMLKNAREGGEADGLYTENAKRAEHILQYVPGLYACDVFDDTPITRYTSRLLQPVWEDGFVSDWWLPYGDAAAYAANDRQTLDMTALCQGFQLAPVYDPLTRGGRYPAKVRVVIIRDKELRLRMADALNNPAYGSGMSPLGAINKLIYLKDSREWLRQGKLTVEEDHFRCENTQLSPEAYRAMTAMAALQEWKGRLVDALYRRESVLSEVRDTQPDYQRLHDLMNQPVDALESRLSGREKAQLSGYDADMDYLRRMGMEREWKPGPKKQKTFRFAPDNLRQASIESGFAMRAACLRYDWDALALAQETPVSDSQLDGTAGESEAETVVSPWLDYNDALAQPTVPAQPPLWLNAADPCYLTSDVGGLYPTDEELRQTGAEPPDMEALQAMVAKTAAMAAADSGAAAEGEAATKTKGKKTSKGGKKSAGSKNSKKQAAQATDHREFSDEEMERRQMVLVLPQEETAATAQDPGSMNKPTAVPAVTAAEAGSTDAPTAAVPVQNTGSVDKPTAIPAATAAETGSTDAPTAAATAQDTGSMNKPTAVPAVTAAETGSTDTDSSRASAADTTVSSPDPHQPEDPAAQPAQAGPSSAESASSEAAHQPEKPGKPRKPKKPKKGGKSEPISGQISFLSDGPF